MAKAKQEEVNQDSGITTPPIPAATKRAPTEYTSVTLSDGRVVQFAGKRKMNKNVTLHEGGGVSVVFDFVNGETRTFNIAPDAALFSQFAGHGISQKIGDEASGITGVEDIVIAVDNIIERLTKGEWGTARTAGDSFSGSNVVIRAIAEVTGKTTLEVKDFLNRKLETAKAAGEKLSRQDLYNSFRKPGTKTAAVIERLEAEKASPAGVDAESLLSELG